MSDKIEILTPVGRLVQGDPYNPNTTDAEGAPLVIKNGPNKGQSRVDYYLALAIPKADLQFNEVWAKMNEAARKCFPHLFDAAGNCTHRDFAWKLIDGDSAVPNNKGVCPKDREGFKGNWILRFSSGFQPRVFIRDSQNQLVQSVEPEAIKRGYYVRIHGYIAGNESSNQPGIYLNHDMIERVAFGEVIVSGPDGLTVFGGTPVGPLPAGASATPIASAPVATGPSPAATPGLPGATTAAPAPALPGAQTVAPAYGAPPYATPGLPGATTAMPPVTPAPDFLAPKPTPQGPPPGLGMAAPAPAMYRAADGNVYSAQQFLDAGYTQAQLDTMPRVS